MPSDRSKRTSKACLQCRKKKRRCNGLNPCRNCTNGSQLCIYSALSPKKPSQTSELSLNETKTIQDIASSTQKSGEKTAALNSGDLLAGRLASSSSQKNEEKTAALNSGDLLAERLGLSTDIYAEDSRLCSWNLRLLEHASKTPAPLTSTTTRPVSELLSTEILRELGGLYFKEVQPVYKILDLEMIMEYIHIFPVEPPQSSSNCVLLGMAALASLFDPLDYVDIQTEICDHARASLEYATTLSTPTIDHVVGWLLRVIYLRFTSSPNATWLASCTLMHMIGTVGLDIDPDSFPEGYPKPQHTTAAQAITLYSPELIRQIYYTASLFNIWISYDLGQPRTVFDEATCDIPSEGWTQEDRTFWELSDRLDPHYPIDSKGLEDLLDQTVSLDPSHPALRLKRCNIALCIYRRLRLTGQTVSTKAVAQVLQIADNGLLQAEEMGKYHSPWWHVLNIPFQILCVAIAIDTEASLPFIQRSIEALQYFIDTYGMKPIIATFIQSCTLLRYHIRKKAEKFDALDRIGRDVVGYWDSEQITPSFSVPIRNSEYCDLRNWPLEDEAFSAHLFTVE